MGSKIYSHIRMWGQVDVFIFEFMLSWQSTKFCAFLIEVRQKFPGYRLTIFLLNKEIYLTLYMDVVYTLTQRFLIGLSKQLQVVLRRCGVSEMKYIYWSLKQECYYSNIYGQIKIYLQSTMLQQRLDNLTFFVLRERFFFSFIGQLIIRSLSRRICKKPWKLKTLSLTILVNTIIS